MPNMIIRVIDAYVYIPTKNGLLFLLLKRAKTKMYEHIWQGVAGKIEKGEKSWETAQDSGLVIEWAGEMIERRWVKASKGGVRPGNTPIGHTALLLIAAKVATSEEE